MNEKIRDITKIIVAQRISTARNAKKIIVLDNGQIVGFDTHDNLMKNCEIYIDIYNIIYHYLSYVIIFIFISFLFK